MPALSATVRPTVRFSLTAMLALTPAVTLLLILALLHIVPPVAKAIINQEEEPHNQQAHHDLHFIAQE